jgi:hypothetical protein
MTSENTRNNKLKPRQLLTYIVVLQALFFLMMTNTWAQLPTPQPSGSPLFVIDTFDESCPAGPQAVNGQKRRVFAGGMTVRNQPNAYDGGLTSFISVQSVDDNSRSQGGVGISAPRDRELTVGRYYGDTNYQGSFQPTLSAGVAMMIPCSGLSMEGVRGFNYTIREISYTPQREIRALALDFVSHGIDPRGNTTMRAITGYVRFNSLVPITYTNGLSRWLEFDSVWGAPPSVVVESNVVQIQGLSEPTLISVTGAEFALNGGAYSAASRSARNGDWLRLRAATPEFGNANTHLRLAVGLAEFPWRLTTEPGLDPKLYGSSIMIATSVGDDPIGRGETVRIFPNLPFFEIGGIGMDFVGAASRRIRLFPTQRIGNFNFESWVVDIEFPVSQTIRPGRYTNVASFGAAAIDQISLDVQRNSRSCKIADAVIDVLEYQNAFVDGVRPIAFDVAMTCSGAPQSRLYLSIRYGSVMPLPKSNAPSVSRMNFASVRDARPGTWVYSAAGLVDGVVGSAIATVSGGEISVDGAAFATSALVSQHSTVQARVLTLPDPGATTTAAITILGQTSTFSVFNTTGPWPADNVFFENKYGVDDGAFVSSNEVTLQGLPRPSTVDALTPTTRISVNGGAFTNQQLTVRNGDRLRLGGEAPLEPETASTIGIVLNGRIHSFVIMSKTARPSASVALTASDPWSTAPFKLTARITGNSPSGTVRFSFVQTQGAALYYGVTTGLLNGCELSVPPSGLVECTVAFQPGSGLAGSISYFVEYLGDAKNGTAISNYVAQDFSYSRSYSGLWWGGEQESGWGMSIDDPGLSSRRTFVVLYVYDSAGKPTWYVVPGGNATTIGNLWVGTAYRPRGTPLSAYDASRLQVGTPAGEVQIRFLSDSEAEMRYVLDGISGSKRISKQRFGAINARAIPAFDPMWWGGGAENGWGIALVRDYRDMFGVMYTYDLQGNPTWFVMPGGNWQGNQFVTDLYSTSASRWLGTTFSANSVRTQKVGSATINLFSPTEGRITYQFQNGQFAGLVQSKLIEKQR